MRRQLVELVAFDDGRPFAMDEIWCGGRFCVEHGKLDSPKGAALCGRGSRLRTERSFRN